MAKYTVRYIDFLKDTDNQKWVDDNIVLSTTERSTMLKDAIRAMWGVWEIGGETIGEFEEFMLETLNEHKHYYEQMLDGYDREYDYETGLSDVTTSTTTGETDSTGNSATTEKGIHVDLPNKQIDADDIYKYPDSGDSTDTNINTTDNVTSKSTGEIIRTYNARYLDLKRAYLNQVRDLYREYAERFSECFVHLF